MKKTYESGRDVRKHGIKGTKMFLIEIEWTTSWSRRASMFLK